MALPTRRGHPRTGGGTRVLPGDNIKTIVTVMAPMGMEHGLRFAIREGGRTVGSGVVATIIE